MRSTPSRFRVLCLCALAGAITLAGCGDPTTDDRPPAAAAPAEAPADADPPAAPDANRTEGCVDDVQPDADYFPDKVAFDEATGVSVTYERTHKVVDVTPPAAERPVRYVLVQCGAEPPPLDGDLAGAQVIDVPVRDVVTVTTTNLPHFDALGAVDRLVGVGVIDFVVTESVLDRRDELDSFVDETGSPDLERLIDAGPDLLIIDGFGDAILDDVARYVDAGVPTAVNADFNERTLLGRAEWVKFTSLFLNAEARANEVYDEVADAYAELVAVAAEAAERPKVLVNTPFEGTWFTPGGGSFLASAIADAGGDYAFADSDETGSLPLDIETVLDRAADADVWIQAGSVDGSLDDLLVSDARFAEFAAFQDGNVWAWDAWVTEAGGHAVFEVAYLRGDWFLADLVAIFHPDLLPEHEFIFFGRVGR